MRVTNMMMTTGMLNNIMSNKYDMNRKFDQYATGQKIQKPSEDPVIAIRSLKYRANLTQIDQYLEKNVEDAYSWMDVTESALKSMSSLLTNVYTYVSEGANDTYETVERATIENQLLEYKNELYSLLNTDNAGRYVFSGFRTDTEVVYTKTDASKQYEITEPLTFENMFEKSFVTGCASYTEGMTASDYTTNFAPNKKTVYCMDLSYAKLDAEADDVISFGYLDEEGEYQEIDVTVMNSTDENAYDFGEDSGVRLLADTGEIIFSADYYDTLRTAKGITATYQKTTFEKNDIRPEMYFDCVSYELNTEGERMEDTMTNYANPIDQDIEYNISTTQSLKVNTLANQVLNASFGRKIDNVLQALNKADATQAEIDNVKLLLSNSSLTEEESNSLKKLQEQLETELAIRKTVLQDSFSVAMKTTQETQSGSKVADRDGTVQKIGVNITLTNTGSRYSRLQLVQNRLEEQQESVTELLDSNEAMDLEKAIINYNAANTTYNASLNAAAKVVQNSLLDFL